MLNYKQFKDSKYLTSVFTPIYYFNSNLVLSEILNNFREICDGEPIIIPLPDGAPQDLPRIILKSKNDIWRLEFSNSRVNIHAELLIDNDNIIGINEFLDTAVQVLAKYKETTKINFGRIAVVVNRQIQLETPGLSLAKHFCYEKWINTVLNRPERFELHAYKRFKLNDDFPVVNSWIRHKGIDKDRTGEIPKGIIQLEQDLNTPQERVDSEDLSIEQIKKFYLAVPSEMESLLERYYPTL